VQLGLRPRFRLRRRLRLAALAAFAAAPAPSVAAAPAVAPIVIVAGGYATCLDGESPTHGRVYDVARAVARALPFDVSQVPLVTSCFGITGGGSVTPTLRYAFPNAPERTGTVDGFVATLSTWLATPQLVGRPLVVYGQSHGGWLALRSVLDLKARLGRTPLPPLFVATLDPIDYLGCTPGENDRLMRAVLRGERFPSPCSRAPALSTYGLLDGSPVPEWRNLYQDRCAFLHSGPLTSATNELTIPPSTMAVTDRRQLDQVLAGQGSDLAWMPSDLRDDLLTWLVQRRPELDFTLHSGMPDYTIDTIRLRVRSWYERVARL
jgi:hypothetical protein